ncbi:MAG: hypothetical protein QQW96_17940 [Tychonema bourrellyi B0820]|uniref:Glycosyl transferase family 1 domain-containing protein n=1 Tax=Tychonema bourrellyi FEM_GT703 TaxID=2040638 RepID=A0A2G4EXG0_9CYAN|nr:hypothetical protein [Tychonema bourrellyi]MDQ2099515.1 hypothetical protein [Tychonema bourrellyi B0820]PHX54166.1 hypothetical protein CP500_017590 [Tychonema bourrellyi FEM_GT703]
MSRTESCGIYTSTIVSPYDEEGLVTGLQQLANCADLRLRMSDSARQRAEEFTWEKVARRLAELVLDRLKSASKIRV